MMAISVLMMNVMELEHVYIPIIIILAMMK